MDSTLALAFLLIGIGFVLLVAELFIPTGGVLFMLTVVAMAVGIALAFTHDPYTGFMTLLAVFLSMPFVAVLFLYIWPRTPIGRRLILQNPDAAATFVSAEDQQELERLVGRFGRATSTLRPAGVVDFDGRRIDTVTEGVMVEPGQWVQCIAVRAGKVIVRPVDKPDLGLLETADFGA